MIVTPRLALLALLLPGSLALACPPTPAAEAEKVFDIITGQVPAHGETYWTFRELRNEASLRWNLMDARARLLLAEARAALGHADDALAVLSSLESVAPGDAGAAAMRAHVLERSNRRWGAAEALSAGLKSNPQACPGLGDLHLRAIRWEYLPPNGHNFLGELYASWPAPAPGARSDADYSRLLLLAARRPRSPDAMLIIGDELYRRGAPSLAIWAWVRALHLEHPAKYELRRRIESTVFLWRVGSGRTAFHVDHVIAAIRRQFAAAAVWLARFQRVEMKLVLEGREPTFAEVLADCEKRGIRRVAARDCEECPVSAVELTAAEPNPSPGRTIATPLPSLDPWTKSALQALGTAAATLLLACLAGFILSCVAPRSPRKSRALTLSRFARHARRQRRGPPLFGRLYAC